VEVTAEIEALVGPGCVDGLDFEAIETAVRRKALAVAARAVERRLNADTFDHAGPSLPCPGCGNAARYAGRHDKTFTSVLGELRLSRAYYHCDGCQAGFCPRDRALGVEDTSLSPAVIRMTGKTAAMVSFAESSELLSELAGVAVDAKQVERTAEALGREIAEDERNVVEPATPGAPTMYLGMDGTGVPMRGLRVAGAAGQAGRRQRQDARGQARHGLERRGEGQGRHPRARRGLRQLLGRHRERRHAGHR